MTVLTCPIPGCGFTTTDVDVIGAAAILNVHSHIHAANATRDHAAPAPRAPRLERPKLQMNATTEDWNAFIRRWETFRTGSSISDGAASGQLLECTGEQLGNIVLRASPTFTSLPLPDALKTLKTLAVIPVALGVVRSELLAMRQDPDEPFRTFAARVQGKAETCEFKTTFNGSCTNCRTAYQGDIYYTDEVIRDVLLNGIADIDIRRDSLSSDNIQTKPVTDVIAYVENKETARNAHPSTSISALSAYRRNSNPSSNKDTAENKNNSPSTSDLDRSRTANCPDCDKTFHLFSRKSRGWNRKPHTRCETCWKKNRESRRHNSQRGESSLISHTTDDTLGQISSVSSVTSPSSSREHAIPRPPMKKPMEHRIFTKGEWRRAQVTAHPTINLLLALNKRPSEFVSLEAIADTGAQSNLWSLDQFLSSGFKMSDLSPASLSLNAANKSPIRIDGVFHAHIKGASATRNTPACQSMVYVSRDVRSLYLSYDSMLQLGVINYDFPVVGKFQTKPTDTLRIDEESSPPSNGSICGATKDDGGICDCPRRTPVPVRPNELPLSCSPENNGKMRDWLLKRYSSSTFNTCPHQQLPRMDGPPIEIHLKEGTQPVACHKAIPIPVHWQEKVYADLHRDEALDVIERVPIGEPVSWCHRMVVARKHDGSPRRTVDLSPLNKHCGRETHNAESPFHLARRIPRNTWKTVTDAWNGYHSLPLRESDRHLTTFITPIGRWRYKRAPQGFLSSGDGYNRRFDAVLADFPRKERIVDDTLHYDEDLEKHWWRTIDLLILLGNAGIVLNPAKFQFAQREVSFAGFLVTADRIDPLPKYFSTIKEFPTPTSTTDIRSWFGLVNQVSNYAQLREHMAPFRPFLSPRHPFEWNLSLDAAFQSSKAAIVDAIKTGVEIFDLQLPTCLRTDWSKQGIGYFLLQKHCSCSSKTPDCCSDGWRITLAGSRFLSSTEQHYAPIEGEALAITWGLEQTRFFTLGCSNLTIVTDHKPLTKIFGDRTLDEIQNTRLFRLKQRTLPWCFDIIHLPGKSNYAADAASRYPASSPELIDKAESLMAAAIHRDTSALTSITWDQLAAATKKDIDMLTLLEAIHHGFPDDTRHVPSVAQFWQYRHGLHESDGVIVYNDRAVIPPSLRHAVLATLHSAHQGVSMMGARARSIVFWPGMTEDIIRTRAECRDCITNAPSQPSLPSTPSIPPSTPFEKVFADFFDCAGQHYLVIGDRLSGWCDVFTSPHGSPQSGSSGLISCLRNYFARFGVPEEISSDGGPEFVATATNGFLSRWGVTHRLSSAYYPQSNGRAEVAVKTTKRLLRSNTGPSGSLDTDRFLRALMQLRNTPDPDCNISPAQIIFGRPIRDAFAFSNRLIKFSNQHIRPLWREAWSQKESAMRERFHHSAESLSKSSRSIPALRIGDRCYIQNQAGNYPKRWDRSGTVVEDHGHHSYTIKVDGSGRLTRRNRKHLRQFAPASQFVRDSDIPRSTARAPLLPAPVSLSALPPLAEEPRLAPSQPSATSIEPVVSRRPSSETLSTSPSRTPPGSDLMDHSPFPEAPRQETHHTPCSLQQSDATMEPPSRPVRSTRSTRRPRTYEPETGLWI